MLILQLIKICFRIFHHNELIALRKYTYFASLCDMFCDNKLALGYATLSIWNKDEMALYMYINEKKFENLYNE